jgi:ketosteroid isomerase-like protein
MNSKPTPNPEEVFTEQIAAYSASDLERLLSLYADSAVMVEMADPDRRIEGSRISSHLEEYFSAFADIKVRIENMAVADEMVFGEVIGSARELDPDHPEAPGTEVRLRFCVVDCIRSGKIESEHIYGGVVEGEPSS